MIETRRAKWSEDVQELLKCPICISRPKANVYQCVHGHHICDACKIRLPKCPICTHCWSPTRNRLAENLCAKFGEIKLRLMGPEDESNKVLIPERVSMSTQTGEKSEALPVTTNSNSDHKGSYPCRFSVCNTHHLYESMNMHLRRKHKQKFLEMKNSGPVFEYTFIFNFVILTIFERAFYIPNMGIFFLKLNIDVDGTFTGALMMVHHRLFAEQYTYQMQIGACSRNDSTTHTGNVWSCRTSSEVLFAYNMKISYPAMKQLANYRVGEKMKCKIILSKTDPNPELDQQS